VSKNKGTFLIMLATGLTVISPVFALTPDQIAQQQLVILQQQEQARQAESAARELREAERIRKSRPKDKDADTVKKSTTLGKCPKIETITVLGNTIFSNKRIAQITNPYIGDCITRDNMNQLQNDLMAVYIDHKYTLARVYFDKNRSRLALGPSDIVFIIEEGIVNKTEYTETIDGKPLHSEPLSGWQKFRIKTKTVTAVPGVIGKVFNMKDFEQGLDQINRLQSNNATMDIRPSSGLNAAGYSDIVMLNKRPSERTTFYGIGLDNGGNKNVGENNLNINLNQDNLLALNDNIYIKYTTDTDFQRDHHYSQSIYSSLSIPYGYWTFNTSLSWSDYKTTVDGLNTSFHTLGDTLTNTFSLDRVLYRSARYRTNLGTTLQLRDTENWIQDIKSVTGSRKSSNVNIFWNNTIYHQYGTLIIKPSYQRGLDWFGSQHDKSDIYDTEPHLQYNMLKMYLYSSIKFDTSVPITWILTADGQYSFQNLYGVDQQSLGGEYTIRGFHDSTISGDNGFYVRNDIRVPIWNILPDFMTKLEFMDANDNWSLNNALKRTQISLFGDYGYVQNRYKITPDPYNSNHGSMAGVGTGLNYTGKYLNWSLMYARTLDAPDYLQTRDGIKKEEQSIYWHITANY
jgi:hemolysin activation/secretion protein